MVKHRSVSQVKELSDCGYRYYLHRIATDKDGNRLWQRPAAWLPQGLAVHEAGDVFEKSFRTMSLDEVQAVYTASYDEHTNRLSEDTPNFSYWFRSGPYAGKEDIGRRHDIGLEQVGKYVTYYTEKHPEEKPLILDTQEPAVEWPFEVKFGDVEVKGVIDFIKDDFKPRDNKSGNKPPDDQGLQLGTYAGVIEIEFDVKPSVGDFWMGKTGKPTVPYDVSDWTPQRLADVYGEADRQIREEEFEPDPEPSKCMFCSVAADCKYSM